MDLKYNIDTNGKILVWICSQTKPLGYLEMSKEEQKGAKILLEDEDTGCSRDIDFKAIEAFFHQDKGYEKFSAQIEIKELINPRFENFKEKLKELDNQSEYHCFIFVFLTYCEPKEKGEYDEEKLHFNHESKDEGLVPQAKIIDAVKDLHVTRGKPKIFLIQADDLSLLNDKATTLKTVPLGLEKVIKIPTDADQLIIKSTIPQRIANKSGGKSKESFLIQAFLEAIKNKKENEDLFTLTPTVNKHVSDLIAESKDIRAADMHVPLVTSTLTKLVYL